MTRPEIIRADSIDLQDQISPSAQDHSRQPTHPAPLGIGPPAPHQAEALRELAVEAAEENHRSPRVSKEWTNGDVQQLQRYGDDLAAGVSAKLNGANLQKQDNLAVAQNGGLTGSTAEDAEMADAEGDDGMDDDMMDKISSSPSIDDGGYPLPQFWPQRSDSLIRGASRSPQSFSQACIESSSPFVDTPAHFPLHIAPEQLDKGEIQGYEKPKSQHHHHHHHLLLLGEYSGQTGETGSGYDRHEDDPRSTDSLQSFMERYDRHSQYDEYYDLSFYSDEDLSRHFGVLCEEYEGGLIVENESGDCLPTPAANGLNNYNVSQIGDNDQTESEKLRDEPQADHEETGRTTESERIDNMTVPYESSDEDDDDYEIPYAADARFVDSGWGGECLQDTEDIDFDFVYALHTFVATVEGQANATKGDTMVLLDDSNSYWWLVRVVKDSSIGYLPAEHIETPTERLARLNKHRNIDLTSTMLGDQAEKSKNPLKKAIRRRNAKTVTFTAPTYVEASDIDYSTEEEDGEGDYYGQNGQEQNGDQQEPSVEEEESATVEPLKPRAEIREVKSESMEPEVKVSTDAARTSDEIFEGKLESKSRNGTVRNTDSFFKDDTVETRKITLTPNLLRDDSSTSTRTSNDSKELKQRPSLDRLEKDSPEKGKDKKDRKDKKDKDKKPGMLSGLFKRKEKKSKAIDDEIDEVLASKRSTENSRASPVPSKDSEELVAVEEPAPVQTQDMQRQPSKLQKQPRTEISPNRKQGQSRELKIMEPQQGPGPERAPPAESVQAPSMRLVQPERSLEELSREAQISGPELASGIAPVLAAPKEQKSVGAISKMLRSASSNTSDPKPIKAKKSKSRVELDDFDSSTDNSPVEEPTRTLNKQIQRPIPGSFPDSYASAMERPHPAEERLSESPVQISPVTSSQSYPPPLMVDTSSQEEPPSPVSSPSPELIDAEDAREKKGPGSSTTSTSTPTWSDAHLRTFFDDDADIKDLLVVVYDKSGVVPAGPDHPITGNLFREENAKLADITTRLDGMLGDWLARKMRAQASR